MLDCLLLWKVFDGAAMVFGIIDGAVLLAFKWTHLKILTFGRSIKQTCCVLKMSVLG